MIFLGDWFYRVTGTEFTFLLLSLLMLALILAINEVMLDKFGKSKALHAILTGLIIAILITFMFSCGKKSHGVDTVGDTTALKEKFDRYVELAKSTVDEYGWLTPKCDGLLFNSLAAISGFPVDPMLAEQSPGRFRRHPDFSKCKPGLPPGEGSESDWSRDQFRGLMPWALINKRFDVLRRIHDYGQSVGWVMGEGDISRTWLNPVFRNQLKRALDLPPDPEKEPMELSGYPAHLDVLRIWTEYLMSGFLYSFEVDSLKDYAERFPENALYVAMYHKFTDGEMAQAIDTLVNHPEWFPENLPTDKDRFTHYLFQRDPGANWEPCREEGEMYRCTGETHSGIDLMFAAWLILN